MRLIKRTILTILVLIIIGILFRGWIYSHVVTYKSVGVRINYPSLNERLTNYIDSSVSDESNPDIRDIIRIGLSLTSRQLNYTRGRNDNDPNKLIYSKSAHCVGYASFCATSCNYLLNKYGLSNNWKAKHQVGKLYVFGTNIHSYFSSPFFKDHDFVTIENNKTGEVFAIDPTVNDCLLIDFVTYEEQDKLIRKNLSKV